MNYLCLSNILIVISTWSAALLLFSKSAGRKQIAMWGWVCLAVSIWGLGGWSATATESRDLAFLGWKIAHIGTIIIPIVFFHFVYTYCHLRKKTFLILLYLSSIFFLYFNFFSQNLFFGDVRFAFNKFYYLDWPQKRGFIYVLMYLGYYWILLAYSFLLLLKKAKTLNRLKYDEVNYIIISSSVGWLGAHGNFLTIFVPGIPPFSNFLIAIFPIITAYAIIRYRFLDIQVVIKKGVAYSILILFLSLFYFLAIILFEKFLQGFWGYQSLAISGITAFIIGIAFFPLHNRIQRLVDRFIFKKSPDEIIVENELLLKEVAQTEKLKTIATLTSGMAHEIKNPLTVIKTFSEHLPSRMHDKEFLEKFSRLVGSEVDRIDGLVNQLLDFAKPAPPVFKETNINKLLEDSLDFLNSRLAQQRISLHTDLSPACRHAVRIDPNQIRQAFLNIALNAIEAMPSGGTLTIASRFTNDASRFITITISDTGTGIAQGDLPHIFDPFFSKKDFGTGLGLSITHGIIQEHGGKISVETNPGWGTTFTIELPARDSTEKNAA